MIFAHLPTLNFWWIWHLITWICRNIYVQKCQFFPMKRVGQKIPSQLKRKGMNVQYDVFGRQIKSLNCHAWSSTPREIAWNCHVWTSAKYIWSWFFVILYLMADFTPSHDGASSASTSTTRTPSHGNTSSQDLCVWCLSKSPPSWCQQDWLPISTIALNIVD